MSFAIVTPSFNKARYLHRCVQSVLTQQDVEVNYMVLDNCSTDGSAEILHGMKAEYAELQVIIEPDDGQASAINKGFTLTKGEFMGWLNADDFYLPQTLKKVERFFEVHPDVDLVYGQTRILDGELKPVGIHLAQPPDSRVLESYDYVPQASAFWRRRVWDALAPLDIGLNWGFDWDFFIRVSRQFRITFLCDILTEMVFDGQTKTATGGMAKTREFARIARRYGNWTNPTFLFCHYVLALNWIALPMMRNKVTEHTTRKFVEKLQAYTMTLLSRCFSIKVMS